MSVWGPTDPTDYPIQSSPVYMTGSPAWGDVVVVSISVPDVPFPEDVSDDALSNATVWYYFRVVFVPGTAPQYAGTIQCTPGQLLTWEFEWPNGGFEYYLTSWFEIVDPNNTGGSNVASNWSVAESATITITDIPILPAGTFPTPSEPTLSSTSVTAGGN